MFLIQFGARLMAGDFNMAFFSVIPEMRARGFEISLAAWYPFRLHNEDEVRADSCGMFCIGPWKGIKIVFHQAVFGMYAPERSENNSMVMEIERDADDKETGRHQYDVSVIEAKGQGYPLSSYMPKSEATKNTVRQFDVSSSRCQRNTTIRGGGAEGRHEKGSQAN